jgi:hypothetical protein
VKISKEINRTVTTILPEFAQTGSMFCHCSADGLLRGLYFEESGLDKEGFYVWVFALPLFIPTSHVSFTFGERLAKGKRWKLDKELSGLDEVIRTEAVPFLGNTESVTEFIKLAEKLNGSDPYVLQALAYSYLKLSRQSEALKAIDSLLATLELLQAKDWAKKMKVEVLDLKTRVLRKGSVEKNLLDWEMFSKENLHIA